MTTTRRTLLLHGASALAGLACALLLVAMVRGTPLPFSGTAASAGLVASRVAHTTVYAPAAGAARDGQQEVRYARERFRDLFGVPPTDLVVVLADDPRQFRRMNLAPLRRRGAGFLPFVTGRRPDSRAGESPGDPMMEMKPLAHEACHIYVAALADRVSAAPGSPRRRAYGHHALPDWFDEAAATLCESAEGHAVRRRHFRASLSERIPLRDFERMPHPLGGADVLERLGVDRAPGQAGVYVITGEQRRRLLPGTNVDLFYSQAFSLGEFIAERGGPGALGSLALPLARERTLDQALREARRTAPGLPPTLDALEAEWIRWVKSGGGS